VTPEAPPKAAGLTVEQIVEKNLSARGGLEAWRKVQTMVWMGHMELPGGAAPQVPFVLGQKRPNKTRFEVNSMGQKTLRVFDGKRGWKVHAGIDGRPEIQAFTPQEVQFAQGEVVIDSPLFDYQSGRVAVELDGTDFVEGRKAFRLVVRTASGQRHNVWVDAQSFLDVKSDRTSYDAAGVPRIVSVYYRDFRPVEGLQIPFTIETGAASGKGSEKMVIEKVALNPALDDRMFARPPMPHRRAEVTIEPERPQAQHPALPAGPTPPPPAPDAGSAPR
jgi:hypothetical protein